MKEWRKPDTAKIREVAQDVLENYKAQKNVERGKGTKKKNRKGNKKQKPPRYFGLIPDFPVQKFVDGLFSGPGAQDPER